MAMHDYAQAQSDYTKDYLPKAAYGAPIDARPETEIDVVRSALKQSRELADYVGAIVNRVCGHMPPEPGDQAVSKDYDPDGVLPQLGAEAQRSMRDINSAMNALRRLADRFP